MIYIIATELDDFHLLSGTIKKELEDQTSQLFLSRIEGRRLKALYTIFEYTWFLALQ